MKGEQKADVEIVDVEKQAPSSPPKMTWSKYFADAFEDFFAHLIGFIPNGLDIIYNDLLKKIPFVGQAFEIQTIETVLKLLLGITIGQGIAQDVAKYVFRPVGYSVGVLIGDTVVANFKEPQNYKGKIGEIVYQLSGQTVFGALFGLVAVLAGFYFSTGLTFSELHLDIIAMSIAVGASVGLMAKAMLLLAINMVQKANAANMRRNVKRAKTIGTKLKEISKQKAKSRVYREAQDLIQQMNGPKSQETMETFFKNQYESMVYNMNKKIDRHFNFLIDKACCGDIEAQKKLVALIPKKQMNKFSDKTPLELMMDRIFNHRMLFQLKDDIDNSYDRWRYLELRESIS